MTAKNPETRKLYIRTFGCQMNEYDSDKMADVLGAHEELVKTDNPEEADVILFNTCSVREKAQERVFHDLGRVRLLKQTKPGLIIGVGGCVASQEGEAIVRRAPYVDVVFGPQTLHRLPSLIEARKQTEKVAMAKSSRGTSMGVSTDPKTRAAAGLNPIAGMDVSLEEAESLAPGAVTASRETPRLSIMRSTVCLPVKCGTLVNLSAWMTDR